MAGQKIRIKLKAYDHNLIDQSADRIVEAVKKTVRDTGLFEEVIETHAGGVISSHCGPNTLGVLFIAQE